jgi:glutathione S-transferase
MSLTLYFHPFSSYCQKALIALYENETPFQARHIDLANPADAAALKALWGLRKFPVLRDDARNQTVPESSVIVEYLASHYPGRTAFIPKDADAAWKARLMDRFFDLHIGDHAYKIITNNFRPAGKSDDLGVEQARAALGNAYAVLEGELEGRAWAAGSSFTLADCAAAPALFYADLVAPVRGHKNIAAYFDRLMKKPSVARTVKEGRAALMEGFPYRAEYLASYERSIAA